MKSQKWYKMTLSEADINVVVAGLALLESENEVHLSNLEDMTPDEQTPADIATLKTETERADMLRVKLVRMLNN